LNKENIPSRAYIAFKTEEQLAQFSREYDGHLFRDKAGNESYAVVEFAPYQKVPPEKKKIDARSGTLEKDEDYISFLESLNAAAGAEPVSLESLSMPHNVFSFCTNFHLLSCSHSSTPAPEDDAALGSPQSRESGPERERDGHPPNCPAEARRSEEEERERSRRFSCLHQRCASQQKGCQESRRCRRRRRLRLQSGASTKARRRWALEARRWPTTQHQQRQRSAPAPTQAIQGPACAGAHPRAARRPHRRLRRVRSQHGHH
ncbi:Smg-4/UPF3 family-domain-containing protein, partial [Mycena capillaripes]